MSEGPEAASLAILPLARVARLVQERVLPVPVRPSSSPAAFISGAILHLNQRKRHLLRGVHLLQRLGVLGEEAQLVEIEALDTAGAW